jgi:dipeptidyl aminopeptidase/acylaminoacyl peptidase
MPAIMTTRLMVVAGVLAAVTVMVAARAVALEQTAPSPAQAAAPTQGAAPAQPAAPARPSTDVFVAPLKVSGAAVTIGSPVNISSSTGYDNQPSFTPDGASILFTSVRGDAKQSEIYRFDFGAGAGTLTRLTETAESEYSPTVTPDGKHFSVIRVEGDGTQRLWQFTIDGKSPSLVLTDVKPVGYHAWTDDRTLALFVLGKPATLQVADRTTGAATTIAHDIGRSIQRIPGRNTVSFVWREVPAGGNTATLSIRELDPKTRAVTPLVSAVAGATEADLAWTPDGLLLMAHNGALYGWRRGDATWTRVADLAALGLTGVSRMAVSPKGDRIAFVANQP